MERREHGTGFHIMAVNNSVRVREIQTIITHSKRTTDSVHISVHIVIEIVVIIFRIARNWKIYTYFTDSNPCVYVRCNVMKNIKIDRVSESGEHTIRKSRCFAVPDTCEFFLFNFFYSKRGITCFRRYRCWCCSNDLRYDRLCFFVDFLAFHVGVQVPGDEAKATDDADESNGKNDAPNFFVHIFMKLL